MYPMASLYCQVLHLGDPALDDPQDEQTRPEDPEGAGGGQGPAGQAAQQEGWEGFQQALVVVGLCLTHGLLSLSRWFLVNS